MTKSRLAFLALSIALGGLAAACGSGSASTDEQGPRGAAGSGGGGGAGGENDSGSDAPLFDGGGDDDADLDAASDAKLDAKSDAQDGATDAPDDADDGGSASDASDGGAAIDASDGGGAAIDASDGGGAVDASDGGGAVDASDGGGAVDASDGGSASDASDGGGADAGTPDDCPGATIALAATGSGTYAGAVNGSTSGLADDRSPSCAGNGESDAVYAITPSVDGTLTVKLRPSGWDAALAIRSTCTSYNSEVACADDGGAGGAETWTAAVTAGVTYYAVVDGAPTYGASSGPFTLDATLVPKGVGDACPGLAVPWSGSPATFSVGGDTTNDAHDLAGSCVGATARDAIYSVTAPGDGIVALTLTPSGNWDPALLVQGTCGSQASQLACVDVGYGGRSEVYAWSATSGSTRTVAVSAYSGTSRGAYALDGVFAPALATSSTEKCGGGDLAFSGSPASALVGGDTTGMTSDHYTSSGCGSSQTAHDAVYHAIAPSNGTLQVTLRPFGWDAALFVRAGQCGGGGQLLGCVDGAGASGAETGSLDVAKGDEVWIFVKGVSGSQAGPYTLSVSY